MTGYPAKFGRSYFRTIERATSLTRFGCTVTVHCLVSKAFASRLCILFQDQRLEREMLRLEMQALCVRSESKV